MYLNFETERLFLRPISLNDDSFILKLVNTEGWLKFIGDRNIKNHDDAKAYIQKILNLPAFYYSVFESRDTKLPMGIVTFLHRETQDYPDVGFAMLPEYEGFGYALEACKEYLKHISKSEKHLEKIIAITKSDNIRSINLVKKLGFEYFGQDKNDHQLTVYINS